MDVVIRPAVAGEAEQILGLQRLCYWSEAEHYEDWSIPPMTQTLPELLAEYEDHEVLVARLGDEVVGSVRGWEEGGTCRVGRLIVPPDFSAGGSAGA